MLMRGAVVLIPGEDPQDVQSYFDAKEWEESEARDDEADAAGTPWCPRKTKQHFIANGEIGRVVAAEPRVVIAQFFDPDRLVKIILGSAKKAKASNGDTGEGEGASDSHPPVDGMNDDAHEGKGSDFDLGYAITTHKAQGSECRVAI